MKKLRTTLFNKITRRVTIKQLSCLKMETIFMRIVQQAVQLFVQNIKLFFDRCLTSAIALLLSLCTVHEKIHSLLNILFLTNCGLAQFIRLFFRNKPNNHKPHLSF